MMPSHPFPRRQLRGPVKVACETGRFLGRPRRIDQRVYYT